MSIRIWFGIFLLIVPVSGAAKNVFKGCTKAEKKKLKEVIKTARTHLPQVTKAVKAALKKGYGKSIDRKLKKAKKKLGKIQANLDDGHTYHCRPKNYKP